MIYADNAATTKLDMDALEAMKPFLLNDYANASEPYKFARSAKQALKEARNTIANCIGAKPEEIFFTSCGTESDNWVIKAVPDYDGRNRIITSSIEHHAILNVCRDVELLGVPVTYLPVNRWGVVEPVVLRQAMDNSVKLVSVMFANNEIGSIQPIKELCEIAHAEGALFHTDAVQALGHVSIDVKALGVDFLSASAHKFNGPKGIGFLYKRQGAELRSFISGGAQEFGLRAGTENVASIVAMAVALEKNCKKIESHAEYLHKLEEILLSELNQAGVDYHRNGAEKRTPGNISLSFKGLQGEMLLHRLDLSGICISTGSACDSKNTQLSHVLRAIQLDEKYAYGTIRISLGKDNTVEEVLRIAKALISIVR